MESAQLFLLLAVCGLSSVFCDTTTLKSPRSTDSGEWLDWKRCEKKTYIFAMQIQYDEKLRNVAFLCHDPESFGQVHRLQAPIISYTSYNGHVSYTEWHHMESCSEPTPFVVGFSLRDSPDPSYKNSISNIAAYCGSAFGFRDRSVVIKGYTPPYWGNWTKDRFCPKNYVVCGFRVQGNSFVSPDSSKLASGFNNIDMECCELFDKCTARYSLEKIFVHDNSEDGNPISKTYNINTTYSRRGVAKKLNMEDREDVLARIIESLTAQGYSFTDRMSKENGTNQTFTLDGLQDLVHEAMMKTHKDSKPVSIPAYGHTVVKQFYITCGEHKVGLMKTAMLVTISDPPFVKSTLFLTLCILFAILLCAGLSVSGFLLHRKFNGKKKPFGGGSKSKGSKSKQTKSGASKSNDSKSKETKSKDTKTKESKVKAKKSKASKSKESKSKESISKESKVKAKKSKASKSKESKSKDSKSKDSKSNEGKPAKKNAPKNVKKPSKNEKKPTKK